MIQRVNTGDRIILFTLVDLLVQVIFCGFLLFAVNRASQGEIQDRLALLARIFGVVRVTRYLDATSKLVAISDLGRIDFASTTVSSTRSLDEITALLRSLDTKDLRALAAMDEAERSALLKVYGSMSADDRKQLVALVRRNGLAAIANSNYRKLEGIFVSMTPDQQGALLRSAQEILPKCFSGEPAFRSVEMIGGGYLVSDPIRDMSARFAAAVRGLPRSGDGYFVSADGLDEFGSTMIRGLHCNLRVLDRSETNSLYQYQRFNRYFVLE